MGYSILRSHAKINLALNIVGKAFSLHKIESIVSFLDLYDEITIKKIQSKKHKIKFIGKFSDNIKSNNTISRLLEILYKKKLLQNIRLRIIVKKNIPSKAGLGGGSMNAATILKFLIKKKLLKTSKKEIYKICSLIGSDVFLGMFSNHLILRSNNTIKKYSIRKNFLY